jgi:hypothetical protein
MYIHEAEPLGEPLPLGGYSAAAAIAVPVAGGVTLAMVFEAIAFVVSAIAAAYLLIRAYEEAEKRGIGLGLAAQALSAGVRKLLSGARKVVDVVNALIARARRITNPDPRCRDAIEALVRAGGELSQSILELEEELRLPVPRVQFLRPLMNRIRLQASQCAPAVRAVLELCRPQLP